MGAGIAAVASHSLAVLLERARAQRLTRHQHILFKLGELIAWVEGAGALARRAARAGNGELDEKADARLTPAALAAASRLFAREAAAKVGAEGMRLAIGADGVTPAERADFVSALGLSAIHDVQAGLIADADALTTALYEGIEE